MLDKFSDIDECVRNKHNCLPDAGEECFNKKGGFKCVCFPGLKRENGKCVGLYQLIKEFLSSSDISN